VSGTAPLASQAAASAGTSTSLQRSRASAPVAEKMGQRALVSLQTLAPVKLKFRNLIENLKNVIDPKRVVHI
jgi:hypothetical protein